MLISEFSAEGRTGLALMRRVLRHHRRYMQATILFVSWPNIRLMAMRACWYVSPYLVVEGENLLDRAVSRAFAEANEPSRCWTDEEHRSFVITLQDELVASLSRIAVSVRSRGNEWVDWDYEKPLMAVMQEIGREAVAVRLNDAPRNAEGIRLKFLSHVCTSQDIEKARLGMSSDGCPLGAPKASVADGGRP
ncbi:MAG: hypothetical protein WBP72_16230 [Rhodocyclaceae bacterium]